MLKTKIYRCTVRGGVVSDVIAENDEEAMQRYLDYESWSLPTRTNFVTVYTEEIVGGKLCGRRSKHFVMVEPPEPDCLQFFDHAWTSAAGAEVCARCGCRRIITWSREMRRSVKYVSL